MTLQDHFLQHSKTAAMWHPERNGDVTPGELTAGSRKYVWWRCDRGHEWQAMVYSVTAGCACPYCSGKKAIPGETDLATTRPDLVPRWSEKNALKPGELTQGSDKRVLWVCEKGHEWEARVSSIVLEGCSCPYCSGKRAIPGETDLASTRLDLMAQWDLAKNTGVDPTALLPSSHERVWWKCALGHSWQAMVFARTRENASGCPYCTGRQVLAGFNDLATLKPKIAKEWYQSLNGELRPEDVTLGSNKKVWWQCSDGHVWQAVVYSRTRRKGAGCPVCAGVVKPARRPEPAQRKAKPRVADNRPRV